MAVINKPKGIFRKYIYWNDCWRYVYIVSTHIQVRMFEPAVKMVEFKLTKNSKTTYSAERSRFHDAKPRKHTENQTLA